MTEELTSVQKLAEYKADKLIGGYEAIEEARDILVAEHKAQIKPLEEKMQEILGALGIKMNLEGVRNFPSQYGTAHFTTIKRIKNRDRDAWFAWVFADLDNRRDCLTASVAKDEVIKHRDRLREQARAEAEAAGEIARYDPEEINIPGLEIEDYTSVHIRKS